MAAKESGERFGRQFPWCSDEDYGTLQQLAAVDREMARAYERLIRAQVAADAAYRRLVRGELVVDGTFNFSRLSVGAGGGRLVARMEGAQ